MSGKRGFTYYTDGSDALIESRYVRFKKLMLENPLVPIGIAFTGVVLCNGARKMRSTDFHSTQKMMRWRIYGQGASLALLAYLSFKVHRKYKQELSNDCADK